MNVNIKKWLKRNILSLIGLVVGVIGGYAYYHYVGCVSGTCPLTSNPYSSMFFGGIMGYLLFDMFKPSKKKEHENS